MSVGNLPPRAKVLIKITYVCQLRYEAENIVFELPCSVAPWDKRAALAQQAQVHNQVATHIRVCFCFHYMLIEVKPCTWSVRPVCCRQRLKGWMYRESRSWTTCP